jgi:hypothetical protein
MRNNGSNQRTEAKKRSKGNGTFSFPNYLIDIGCNQKCSGKQQRKQESVYPQTKSANKKQLQISGTGFLF